MNTEKLGINGLGRIGKLTLWHHVARKAFKEIVVNIGRPVGKSLKDVAHYIERDSTYGLLERYLHGYRGAPVISAVDDANGVMFIDGVKTTFLRKSRNPKDLNWGAHQVDLVVDSTGQFTDPTIAADETTKGAIRGHFQAGAKKVLVSAPFKIKDKVKPMPDDATTVIMGINEHDYDPARHKVVSAASCTTTCLAHLMKPLLDAIGPKRILTASMATVHAATGTQEVLDRLAGANDKDLRKNRSILNNIILTTTGAANTLALVLPEMKQIGFIAESVRIPTTTGSLVILVVNIQEEGTNIIVNKEYINGIYQDAVASAPHKYLIFTEEQNVSSDIIGLPRAAVIVEGSETHTRTADVTIDLEKIPDLWNALPEAFKHTTLRIPLTQAVIYGWYDNEMGSYVNMLGDLTMMIAEND
jgi:glyceraldehyde 3-phosphate dehydrogenase